MIWPLRFLTSSVPLMVMGANGCTQEGPFDTAEWAFFPQEYEAFAFPMPENKLNAASHQGQLYKPLLVKSACRLEKSNQG